MLQQPDNVRLCAILVILDLALGLVERVDELTHLTVTLVQLLILVLLVVAIATIRQVLRELRQHLLGLAVLTTHILDLHVHLLRPVSISFDFGEHLSLHLLRVQLRHLCLLLKALHLTRELHLLRLKLPELLVQSVAIALRREHRHLVRHLVDLRLVLRALVLQHLRLLHQSPVLLGLRWLHRVDFLLVFTVHLLDLLFGAADGLLLLLLRQEHHVNIPRKRLVPGIVLANVTVQLGHIRTLPLLIHGDVVIGQGALESAHLLIESLGFVVHARVVALVAHVGLGLPLELFNLSGDLIHLVAEDADEEGRVLHEATAAAGATLHAAHALRRRRPIRDVHALLQRHAHRGLPAHGAGQALRP
mmetsp:Transcript_4741/g.10297  ORF Transcript_4741/g.10297 Transcript_4741/m.10297 type:complete len:361 (-) Transcript_4741:188-1270(-)